MKSNHIAYTLVSMGCLVGLLIGSHSRSASGASTDGAASALTRARQDLRLSQETEARIAAELETLTASGDASPDILRDYATYLARVRAMRVEHEKLLHELEVTYARGTAATAAPDASASSRMQTEPDVNLPDAIPSDALQQLQREFDRSLADFDDFLLKELEAVRERSTHAMRDLASEAAEAAKRLRAKGVDLDTSAPAASSTNDADGERTDGERINDKTETGRESAENGMQQGERRSSSDRARGSQTQTGNRRVIIDNPEDDDIVARQLREAAEQESDPELKAKLWKEYEDYKRGQP